MSTFRHAVAEILFCRKLTTALLDVLNAPRQTLVMLRWLPPNAWLASHRAALWLKRGAVARAALCQPMIRLNGGHSLKTG